MDGISELVKRQMERLSLIDQVELVHLQLMEGESYPRYLSAIYNEDAVEGSLVMDDAVAAITIRDAASEQLNKLKEAKLADIAKALKFVMRRYGISRKERRGIIGENFVMTEVDEEDSLQ